MLRCVKDTLSIVCLNYIDPSLYAIIAQSSLILTGLLTWIVLKKKVNSLQWLGLSFISLSLAAFSLSYEVSGGGKVFGIVLVVIAVLCKVTASVYLDKVLHEDADIPVTLQSAAISCGTILPVVAYSFIFDWERIMTSGLSVGWSMPVGFLVVLFLAKNWMTNLVVKSFSAVVKYLIYAVAVGGTYFVQVGMCGGQVAALPVINILQMIVGVFTYSEGRSWVSTGKGVTGRFGKFTNWSKFREGLRRFALPM